MMLFCAFASPAKAIDVLRDDEIETILYEFGKPIFEQAGLQKNDVNMILVNSPDLNAFVAGGMNIFVYTGLLLETDNADEVIGVLAHETSHIAAGHLFRGKLALENASKQALLSTLLGVAAAVGGSIEAGQALTIGGQGLASQQFLAHTRANEAAADQGAVNFLRGAGMPPTGILRFMEKLADQELLPSSQQSPYLRTHPLSRYRVNFLQRMDDESLQKGKSWSKEYQDLHKRMKAKLLGYLYPAKALRSKETDFYSDYARIQAYYKQNNVDQALATIEKLLLSEPNNPYLYELRGQTLLENGRIHEAISAYEKAVELHPKSGLIRISLGHAYLQMRGNKIHSAEKAIRHLKQASLIETTSPYLHRLMATAYGRLGQDGYARLHLAEEALLRNKPQDAVRQALYALDNIAKNDAGWLRAQDIMHFARQNLAKQIKKKAK